MSILDTIFHAKKHLKTADGYKPVSEWTLAKDVDCANGKNVEDTIGNINAEISDIGTNLTETNNSVEINTSDIAQNASAIKSLSDTFFAARSHVGMVIQSTTLNTMEKVIAVYGGTSWTRIEGRMLLGASSSYPINSTGGSANAIIPYHNHTTANAGYHSHGGYTGYYNVSGSAGRVLNDGNGASGALSFSNGQNKIAASGSNFYEHTLSISANHRHSISGDGSHAHTVNYTGTSVTGANMPPYKVVYIWERTE